MFKRQTCTGYDVLVQNGNLKICMLRRKMVRLAYEVRYENNCIIFSDHYQQPTVFRSKTFLKCCHLNVLIAEIGKQGNCMK